MNRIGRVVCIDYGSARIGVALSDESQTVARPWRIIRHRSQRSAFEEIQAIIVENRIAKVIIGLPTGGAGELSSQATKVIHWSRKLAGQLPKTPIVFWDESYSTVTAAKIAKANKRRPGKPLDSIAAAAILQDYLDASQGVEHEPGQPLETFSNVA